MKQAIASQELCPCGKPLHYPRPESERAMRLLIQIMGYTVILTYKGRSWKVPRHYIALHGIGGHYGNITEICVKYHFEEVTHEKN